MGTTLVTGSTLRTSVLPSGAEKVQDLLGRALTAGVAAAQPLRLTGEIANRKVRRGCDDEDPMGVALVPSPA
jgi:hypothetical protein